MKYNDTLQCFKHMFQATQTHEWMNDAHVYEMQCKCGSQTPGVLNI